MGLRDRIKAKLQSVLTGTPATPATATPVQAMPPKAVPPPEPIPAAPEKPKAAQASGSALPSQTTPDGFWAAGFSHQVLEGKAGSFGIAGTETVVAVFRKADQLYAIDNACAHEDGPIGEGAIQGTKVRCPYHDWEYDFTTGACMTDPERRQTCWSVREKDGVIWLGPISRKGTAARGGDHNDGMEVIKT